MATITEMAENYSFIGEGTDAKGEIYKDYNSYKYEGFIAGANAVLKEIEDILNITKPYLGNPFATLEERARGVYDLVKELKGE